ncbi:MAG: hypothetical protein ABIZ81_00285 [Opitutaceae bacterium]
MQKFLAVTSRIFSLNFSSRARCAALAGGVSLLGIFAAGCSHTLPPDPMAEAAGAGERPVAMKGDANYFDTKIAATVTVSRGFDRGVDRGKQGPLRGRDRDRKDATTIGLSENYPTAYGGESDAEQKELYEDMVRRARAQRAAGSPMPPVTIRLKLENRGTEPVEVDLLEVNSDLGNFAVRPTKLTLAPGQTGETEPMVSQLGVTSDEIPVKVALRTAGKKETQLIPVKSLFIGMEKK